ncbi:MAG: hypothetical protein Fur005_42460 [Roseiflexaceae bacterium]
MKLGATIGISTDCVGGTQMPDSIRAVKDVLSRSDGEHADQPPPTSWTKMGSDTAMFQHAETSMKLVVDRICGICVCNLVKSAPTNTELLYVNLEMKGRVVCAMQCFLEDCERRGIPWRRLGV